MAAHPIPPRLTDVEARLVERYVGVLDLVSRCAQAVERGDLFALCEHTTRLEPAAERLAEAAGKAYAAWYADRRSRSLSTGSNDTGSSWSAGTYLLALANCTLYMTELPARSTLRTTPTSPVRRSAT